MALTAIGIAALITASTVPAQASGRSRDRSVTLTFDELPGDSTPGQEWWHASCEPEPGGMSVAQGILTIDSPTCNEFVNYHEAGGLWHEKVDSRRGWTVEARVRLDPASAGSDCPSILLWIHDHANLVQVGMSTTAVCLSYPARVDHAMDTTGAFHTYRVHGRRDRLEISVDGHLVISHQMNAMGDGTDALTFGDGNSSGHTISYWDHYRYTVQAGGPR
jgi:hypothetical protein